ncbi:MAG: radical SAM protein [Candidatus Omnitrophica bacterium]|nr:radical SAM protein [Candidatus Omnitrophota bacterium]
MNRLRVLLIDPPYNRLMGLEAPSIYPLGLSYISAVLNKAGHEAVYVNLDYDDSHAYSNPFSREKNIGYYKKYKKECDGRSAHAVWSELRELFSIWTPDIVGISATTLKMKSVQVVAKAAKAYSKSVKVILGGHHSQIYAGEILDKCKDVDYIVKGEGEETMVELVRFLSGSGTGESLKDINGIAFRNDTGSVEETGPRALISDLDSLPFADPAKYYRDGRLIDMPLASIMGTRGCPYDCNYCATNNIWLRKVRRRSVENVIAEIRHRMKNDNIYEFNFLDDCFTMNKKWTEEFCDSILSEALPINWSCISDINSIDEDLFKLIVRSGCNKINLGIESGSDRILRLCNKGLDMEKAKKIFGYARKHRISTTAYFMMGFPTEGPEDIKKTEALIRELNPNWVYMNVLIPLPGTKFFDRAVSDGLIAPERAWSGDIYKHLQANYTGKIDDEEFNGLVDEAYALCYKLDKRVTNIFKRIPFRAYLKQPQKVLSDTKKFAEWVRR